MITAKQLPSGNWRCRVYLGKDSNGKPIYQSITRNTEKKCVKAALEISEKHKAISRDLTEMTLGEAIDAYIASKSNVLSPSTIRGYDQIRRCHFQPEMSVKLCRLNEKVLQTAVNRESEQSSPKTVKNAWSLISATLRANKCEVPDDLTFPKPKKYIGHTFEEQDMIKLIGGLQGTNVEIPVLLALWLGLRLSELVGLSWNSYNSDQRTITIDTAIVRDKNNNLVRKATKTYDSTRVLPVPEYIATILDNAPKDSERIVTMHPNSIIRRFKSICKKNGIPEIRLHDLRHTNASVMCLLNIGDKYAMSRGGWNNVQTMKKIYQHTLKSGQQDADARIDAYFNGLVQSVENKNK